MKICQNCGNKLEDTAAFCAQCGTPAAQTCSECGAPIESGAAFCQSCGKPVEAAAKQPAAAAAYQSGGTSYQPAGTAYQPAGTAPAKTGGVGKIPTKFLLIAAVAVVVIAAVLIAVFVLRPASKSTLVYLKDEGLSFSDLKRIDPYEVTDELYDDSSDYYSYYSVSYLVRTTEDGRYLFYPQDMEDETFDLYMIDLKANNSKSSSAFKVASDVSEYQISLDGKKVFYMEDDKLYFTDLKDKTKIDSDVEGFIISDDGTKLLYQDMDGKLYYSNSKTGGDVEKLDSDASVQHVSSDLSKIWYLKDDTLYYLEIGKDKVKIDSKVSSVTAVYDTGKAYYVKADTDEAPLMDFVNDDMAAADADLKEPDYEDFTTEVTGSYGYTHDEVDYDAYNDAYDVYYEKEIRDELRAELEEFTYTISSSSLFYYDGKESVEITDAYASSLATGSKPMIAYYKAEKGDLPKINISEIEWTYDVEDMLDEALYGGGADVFIAMGAVETEIDQEEATRFVFNTSCTALYFIDNYSDEDSEGELYAVQIKGDSVGSPELYDEEVADILRALKDDAVLYFKDLDYDDYSGDMYINKTAVDTDVYCYNFSYGEKENIYYMTDIDDEEIGTLKLYDGKNTVNIADDVYSYMSDGEKNVAYLTDYDVDDQEGDAYLYNGSKEPELIDREVSMLIMIS